MKPSFSLEKRNYKDDGLCDDVRLNLVFQAWGNLKVPKQEKVWDLVLINLNNF